MNRRLATLVGPAALIAALACAGPASAHAVFVSSDPANGSTLTAAPSKVVLTFDDTLEPGAAVTVVGPNGRVDDDQAVVADKTVTTGVHVTIAGHYVVNYRVISDDGHPVTGTTQFTYVTAASTSPAPAATPAEPTKKSSNGWIYAFAGIAVVIASSLALSSMRRKPTGN